MITIYLSVAPNLPSLVEIRPSPARIPDGKNRGIMALFAPEFMAAIFI
jgi:hypothetical protein